jgi:opacity protein-like surface antigen
MKKIFVIVISIFISFIGFSQGDNDSSNVEFFFSFGGDYGKIYNSEVYLFQISGGFNIGNIEVEGYGKSLPTSLSYSDDSLKNKNLDFAYAGMNINYNFLKDKRISPFVGLGLGIGNASLSDVEIFNNNTKYVYRLASDDLTIFTAQAGITLNITKWLAITLGGKYNQAFGLYLRNLTSEDFTGVSGYGGIKFRF